jgi:hypothetical protein
MREMHSIQTAKGYINIIIDLESYALEWLDLNKENKFFRTRQAAHQRRERLEKKEMQATMNATLKKFLESPDFAEGCKSATKASWGGSGYSVELFPDGTWRVLWDNEIGNLYISPGEIISLPALDDDDYQQDVIEHGMDEDEYFYLVFENDEDELKQHMRNKLTGVA